MAASAETCFEVPFMIAHKTFSQMIQHDSNSRFMMMLLTTDQPPKIQIGDTFNCSTVNCVTPN